MIDKKAAVIVILTGIIIGIITSIIFVTVVINSVGELFKVENVNITISINQTSLEETITNYLNHRYPIKTNPELNSFLYNGIYGWFCDDTSSYEPAISDVTQTYTDRKCHLISIENTTVNRSYYIENGWD